MESVPREMQKLVCFYAGYVAKSHQLPMNDEAAAFLATQRYTFDLMFNDKSVAVMMQIGKERIGRINNILSSAEDLPDHVQDVAGERDSDVVLKDYVVLFRVNGDHIDVTIITQEASLCSLPMDSLSVDLIVCVSGSFDAFAVQKLAEFFRVLKLGSEIFLLLQSASEPWASSPVVQKSMHAKSVEEKLLQAKSVEEKLLQAKSVEEKLLQAKSVEEKLLQAKSVEEKLLQAKFVEERLLQAGFQVLQCGQMKTALQTELFQSIEIKARKKSTLELNDDDDLIDESTLIDEEEEERERPVHPPVPDPEPGRFQAHCTSERCGQGDAFRCRTCPYRGCPRGEPGVDITPNFPPAEN